MEQGSFRDFKGLEGQRECKFSKVVVIADTWSFVKHDQSMLFHCQGTHSKSIVGAILGMRYLSPRYVLTGFEARIHSMHTLWVDVPRIGNIHHYARLLGSWIQFDKCECVVVIQWSLGSLLKLLALQRGSKFKVTDLTSSKSYFDPGALHMEHGIEREEQAWIQFQN